MKEAQDFLEVCEQVDELLDKLAPEDYPRSTGFKDWSVNDIIRHLHVWNRAAWLSLTEPDEFALFWDRAVTEIRSGRINQFESAELDGLSGPDLRDHWLTFARQLADAFAKTDPKTRVAWVGPGMSARSSITARLMETWAHAQAIYDEMGIDRPPTDAIENIVVLGRNTYGWSFKNRGLDVPEPPPELLLTSPSGEVWTYGDDLGDERISGSAEEFCQVVTQCRNIADTNLNVSGENAARWMEIAQCFAGPPKDPPPPGTRAKRG